MRKNAAIHPTEPTKQMDELGVVRGDLSLRDFEHEPDSETTIMADHFKTLLHNQNTRNVETQIPVEFILVIKA